MDKLSGYLKYILRVSLSAVMIMALLCIARPVNAATTWWDSDWTRCRKIAFNNSEASEKLYDFPVLIRLTSGTIDYSACKSNGGDLRFIDADGSTVLSYEIENWDASGESNIWVKVPELDNTNTDYISMYYGNRGASNGWNASDTWSNGYAAVFHMKNQAGQPEFKSIDSQTVDETQGVATDGTYFYLIGWGGIQKYDSGWNLQLSRSWEEVAIECGGAHLGAGACYNGKLYVPVFYTYYEPPCYIAMWNLDDLSYAGEVDISEQGYYPSAIAIDTDHNLLWVCSYISETPMLWKYDLNDLSYQGNINLSEPLRCTQGLTYRDGLLYVLVDTPDNQIWSVSCDGTVQKLLYHSYPGYEAEGIDYSTEYVYAGFVGGGITYLEKLELSSGDSFYLKDSAQALEGRKKNLNEPVQASGTAGYGQTFDGNNDYIDIGNILQQFGSNTPFSIEANVNPSAISQSVVAGDQSSGSNNTGISLGLTNGGRLTFILSGESGNSLQANGTTAVRSNEWTAAAATYDGSGDISGCLTYVNGVEGHTVIENSDPGSMNRSSTAKIGIYDYYSFPFNGSIDEVRISNTVRTASWLKASYLTTTGTGFTTIGAETQRYLSVSTLQASRVMATSATLNGNLASPGIAESVTTSFEYGPDTGYGSTAAGNPEILTESGKFSAAITGLTPNVTYHYRAVATGDETVWGEDQIFITVIEPPSVATIEATGVEDVSAVLHGHLDDLGSAENATVSFEYGLTTDYGSQTPGQALDSAANFNASLTGLTPNSTYHFRAKAIGEETSYGDDLEFTTKTAKVTLRVTTSGQGSVYLEPDQDKYDQGSVIQLTALAETGWSFSSWSGSLSGTDNPVTITMDGNKNITATFIQSEYTLNLEVNPAASGQITVNPVKSVYHHGDTVTLTAQAASDFTFNSWSGSISGTDNPHTIVMDGSKSVTANFSNRNYQLTVNKTGQGNVSRNPDKSSYTPGTSVQLTATASTGWSFSRWSGDLTGTSNPITITMDENKTVTAVFTQNEYNLQITIAPANRGTVTRLPSKTAYHYGDVVTLNASGTSGYVFNNWSGDLTGTNASASVTIRGNTSITANFVPVEYLMTIDITGQGTVNRSPEKATYSLGDTVQLTAAASPGWSFNSWGGDLTGNDNPISIVISDDKSVTANFTQSGYTLTVTAAPANGGSITVDPVKATYEYGDSVTLTAQAAAGYTFKGWSGDATVSAASTSITINGNTNVTANFKTKGSSSASSGGGSGGGGEPQPKKETISLSGFSATANITVNNSGIAENGSRLTTLDNQVILDIAQGTEMKDAAGSALSSLSASKIKVPPEPPANEIIVAAYEFSPDGATFNPPLTLTFKYKTEMENATSVMLAWWDGSAWETVPATFDTENGTVTAQISHFSEYALIAPKPTPAAMMISDVSISPNTVKPNEVVTAQVKVTNSGDIDGEYKLALKINDRQVETKDVTVTGGKTETVNFNIQRVIAGEYRIDINGRTGKFTVADLTTGPTPTTTSNMQEPEGTASTAELNQAPASSVVPEKTSSASPIPGSATLPDDRGGSGVVLWTMVSVAILAVLAFAGVIIVRRRQTRHP